MSGRLLGTILVAGFILSAASVQAATPNLANIRPQGGQRGTEVEVSFNGERLKDAEEIYFYQPGIETVSLEPKEDGKSVKVKFKISPEAPLGEHALRVRTKSGVSDMHSFYVGALTSVEEKEPNNDFTAPQPIELNVTAAGVANSEDVDYYLVKCTKGQRLSVEVEGMRLGNTMFDPYCAILDEKRFELAASDDSPLVFQDCVASVVIPEDGNYIVEVRESSYAGNGNCHYRAHIGTFPRPTAVYPAGGKLGENVAVTYISGGGELVQNVLTPPVVQPNFTVFAQDGGGVAPSGNVFRISDAGNTLEAEPNNEPAKATPAELPTTFNGIIQSPGDVDYFKFTAKKGQVFEVEVYARRLRTGLDSVLQICNKDGGVIAGNDDQRGPDSYLRWTTPDDGEFMVRIQDHLLRGDPSFVYRVELTPIAPAVSLTIPQFARYSQERHHIAVPRGNRYAVIMNAERTNFGGDLNVTAEDLPAGVKMINVPMPANMSSMPLLFEADAEAPIAGSLAEVMAEKIEGSKPPAPRPEGERRGRGRGDRPPRLLLEGQVSGYYKQSADMIVGPNQVIYWYLNVDRLAVAVTEEAPFKIDLVQPQVPIVQNGTMNLKVVATRKEGFTAPIKVQFPHRPPGINGASDVTIPEGQNEVLYPINAAGNAQAVASKVLCIAQADVGGPLWVATNFIDLTVAAPYMTLAFQKAAVEQGETAEVVVKIQNQTPFEGEAVAAFVGLPGGLTCEPIKITKDTAEIVYKIPTTDQSPVGQHKNLFCSITVMQNNEPIVHNIGGTELQIDKPLPAPVVAAPMPMPMPEAAPMPMLEQKPPEKRLTRLEKLRLEAEERAKAGK